MTEQGICPTVCYVGKGGGSIQVRNIWRGERADPKKIPGEGWTDVIKELQAKSAFQISETELRDKALNVGFIMLNLFFISMKNSSLLFYFSWYQNSATIYH